MQHKKFETRKGISNVDWVPIEDGDFEFVKPGDVIQVKSFYAHYYGIYEHSKIPKILYEGYSGFTYNGYLVTKQALYTRFEIMRPVFTTFSLADLEPNLFNVNNYPNFNAFF